jgi:hypothetical protein
MKNFHNRTVNFNKIFSRKFSNESNNAESFYCAHIGASMTPTLSTQDLLEIKSYQHKTPRVGDIVLLFKTKGDYCDVADSWILKKEDVIGQVIAAHRGNKRRNISGGIVGRIAGLTFIMRRKTNWVITKLLRPIYRSLCTDGILHWLIPLRLTPQVATYRSGSDDSHKLLLGKRVIGSYDEARLQWQIKRPYRLVVDENSLPVPDNPV